MKRVPNTYAVVHNTAKEQSQTPEPASTDVSKFLTGECIDLTPAGEQDLRQTLQLQDARAKLFMAAYGQKSIRRLARLMEAIDCVDQEVMAPWRIKALDSRDLISLMAELNSEQARVLKDVTSIHNMNIDVNKALQKAAPLQVDSVVSSLSPQAKGRVLKFMDEKVLDENTESSYS